MEKQRSFSYKSTRFLVLSLTLSFSFVLLSFLFCWAMQASPIIQQEATSSHYFLLSNSSLSFSFNQLNLQSLTGFSVDFSNNTVDTTNLVNTHVRKPEITPGFVANSSLNVSVKSSEVKVNAVKVESFGDLSAKFSADKVKVSNLGGTHLRKSQNASGFVISSISKGKVGKSHNNVARGNVSSGFEKRGQKKLPNLTGLGGGKVNEDIEKNWGKDCDVSKGKWVIDDNYPLYTNFSCPFIDEGFNCQGNGRLDKDYMKWRWQPQDCDIPRFNATNMLELIRGKRLVFAGDSINRNQWESLLCLLRGAVKDPKKVYETRGRRITKNRGTYSFRFVDYQCTVEFYVSHFLVRESKARIGKKRKETLRIDSIAKESTKWRGADILVFNTGNWWSHYKTKAGKNYYQEGEEVHPHLDAITAYRKALMTWGTWVDKHVNPLKTHVFFRSTAPAHFRGGEWNTGGHCRRARNPLSHMYAENSEKDIIAQEVISTMKTPVNFLNVSGLSSYRIDGHPSIYGRNSASSVEDCSHWCLPGVPDAWNELLYHQLLQLKRPKNVYTG